MKTNIWKWLIAVLPLFAVTANAQIIDLSGYAKKSDLQSIENRIKALESGTVNPPAELEDCKPNPTISGDITNISSKGLTFKFNANGLTNMKYMITGSKVYIDSIKPTKNTVDVVFPTTFPNGTYTLSIEGINCKGSNSRTFTIAGGVDPPSSADCKKQPTFKINGFTNQAATIQFDADGLKTLTLSLVQGTETIKSTTYNPDVNTLYFPFGKVIAAGNYKITLTAVSCNAEVKAQEFTIKDEDTGVITPPDENPGIPKFSVTPKRLFKLINTNGVYEDKTPGDYIGADGLRYRKENGIIYRALYWISELPLTDKDGKPVDFGQQVWPNGIMPYVRKQYAAWDWTNADNKGSKLFRKSMPWIGATSQENFRVSGWDFWLHNGENTEAVSEYVYRTVTANITTNGGKDLKTDDKFIRQQNGAWMDAGNLVPQFVFNPAKNRPDKPVVIQCYPMFDDPYQTVKSLYDGGITHVWWQNLHTEIYQNGKQIVGATEYPITPGFNWSSNEFNLRFPNTIKKLGDQLTDEEAIQFANEIYLGHNFVLTDEWSEGGFPAMSPKRNVIYKRLGVRIKDEGWQGVQLLGDYGYGSKNMWWNASRGKSYMDNYYLDLLGDGGKYKLEQVGGSAHTTVKNDYLENGQSAHRGTVVGAYYAITFMSPDLIPGMMYEAILFNTMFPDQPKQRFTTPIMQSNAHGADVPYKNDGTIRMDGTENLGQYPEAPAELLKINAYVSMMFYNSAYLWDAYGKRNVKSKDWYDSSIMTDAWVEGTRWYSNQIGYFNEAGREILVADFTANGKEFKSNTSQRHISQGGKVYFNNTYYNEVADKKVGALTVIPSKKKVFTYVNSFLKPNEIEDVTAHFEGKSYHLGEIAGSTLTTFYEK